jgi:hypothetical protein
MAINLMLFLNSNSRVSKSSLKMAEISLISTDLKHLEHSKNKYLT